jgi:hypothetical protein
MRNTILLLWDRLVFWIYEWSGKKVKKDSKSIMTLVNEDPYKAVERAIRRLDILVEQNKITNERSKSLLEKTQALSSRPIKE